VKIILFLNVRLRTIPCETHTEVQKVPVSTEFLSRSKFRNHSPPNHSSYAEKLFNHCFSEFSTPEKQRFPKYFRTYPGHYSQHNFVFAASAFEEFRYVSIKI
jgi:hypothetical protein